MVQLILNPEFDQGLAEFVPGTEMARATSSYPDQIISIGPDGKFLMFVEYRILPAEGSGYFAEHKTLPEDLKISSIDLTTWEKTEYVFPPVPADQKELNFTGKLERRGWGDDKYFPGAFFRQGHVVIIPGQEMAQVQRKHGQTRACADCPANERGEWKKVWKNILTIPSRKRIEGKLMGLPPLNQTLLLRKISDERFSPNQKYIAYVVGIAVWNPIAVNYSSQVYVMDLQTLKRRRPGFNESYYGFRSFNRLLDEAAARGMIELEPDEKSGGYIIIFNRLS